LKAEIPVLIRRAEESLQAASHLLDESMYTVAVSQAYYAMFYVASAALLTRGLRFKRHASLVRGFASQFVRTGLLPSHLQTKLAAAFVERTRSDYQVLEDVTREEALEQLKRAAEFVTAVRAFLEKESQR